MATQLMWHSAAPTGIDERDGRHGNAKDGAQQAGDGLKLICSLVHIQRAQAAQDAEALRVVHRLGRAVDAKGLDSNRCRCLGARARRSGGGGAVAAAIRAGAVGCCWGLDHDCWRGFRRLRGWEGGLQRPRRA